MEEDQIDTCECDSTPGLIIGYEEDKPILCMICGNKILAKSLNAPEIVVLAFDEWKQKYKSFYDEWMLDKVVNRESGQILKDDLAEINLEGIKISQDLTKQRETYYLMFNDSALGEVNVPDLCPYCGIEMVLYERQKITCCPDCRVAFAINV
jgi:hypothetical protein